jgi:hypothetical protein
MGKVARAEDFDWSEAYCKFALTDTNTYQHLSYATFGSCFASCRRFW